VPSTNPHTIADGLRGALGERPFAAIRAHVDDIVTVPEDAIVAAMRELWEVMKIIVEPSGAVPYAAITAGVLKLTGERVGLVLTGGNLDLDRLPWMESAAQA
jgi:threonine dehydratase